MHGSYNIEEKELFEHRPERIRIAIPEVIVEPGDFAESNGHQVLKPTEQLWQQLEELLRLAEDAKSKPDLLIFPELSVPLDFVERVAAWAKQNGTIVVAGSHYHFGKEKTISRCPVIISGEVKYIEKLVPSVLELPMVAENRLAPGEKNVVFKGSKIGNFGVLICSDFLNGSLRNEILDRGIDLLVVIACQKDSKLHHDRMEQAVCDSSKGLYIVYVNLLCRSWGDGRSAFFAAMHRLYRETQKRMFEWNKSTDIKILEMPHKSNYLVLELNINDRRPAAMLIGSPGPNVSVESWSETSFFNSARRDGRAARGLDASSLANYILRTDIVERIDEEVGGAMNRKGRNPFSEEFIETYLKRLIHVGFQHLDEVDAALHEHQRLIVGFMVEWYKTPIGQGLSHVPKGMGVSFLAHTKILQRGDDEEHLRYWQTFKYNNASAEDLAAQMKWAFMASKNSLPHPPP